jgi:hypothetical protein
MNHHIDVTHPYVDAINHDIVVMIHHIDVDDHHIDVNADRIDVMLLKKMETPSEGGGIAGALISYFDGEFLKHTASGPDGQFSFPLSSSADSVDLFIVTPGFPVKLTQFRVPEPGSSADIVVSSRGGFLSVAIAPQCIRRVVAAGGETFVDLRTQ